MLIYLGFFFCAEPVNVNVIATQTEAETESEPDDLSAPHILNGKQD